MNYVDMVYIQNKNYPAARKNIIMQFSATSLELSNIMLSEVSKKTGRYRVILPICVI